MREGGREGGRKGEEGRPSGGGKERTRKKSDWPTEIHRQMIKTKTVKKTKTKTTIICKCREESEEKKGHKSRFLQLFIVFLPVQNK